MYTEAARQRRRCTSTTKAGEPCRAWACWDDPAQRCMAHAGRHHRGPIDQAKRTYPGHPSVACTCRAYSFPHRPGAGLCRWPDPPEYRLPASPRRYRVQPSGSMRRRGIRTFKQFTAAVDW